MGFIEMCYYVSMNVVDKLGVLFVVVVEFVKCEVSIVEVC